MHGTSALPIEAQAREAPTPALASLPDFVSWLIGGLGREISREIITGRPAPKTIIVNPHSPNLIGTLVLKIRQIH